MSTSCTSAPLAATTSGSSNLARNASLYASIDLHSDDADLRSGEEVSGEEDKTANENLSAEQQDSSKMAPVLQHRISELPISMSMMSAAMTAAAAAAAASTRRNKRKNFQPRNIRPNEDGNEDNNEKSRDEQTGGVEESSDLAPTTAESSSSACCSISESKIISSRHSNDSDTNRHKISRRQKAPASEDDTNAEDGILESHSSSEQSQMPSPSDGELNDGSRNSSRSSSRSSSENGSRGSKSAAVDLRLRPAFNNTEDDEDDETEIAQVSGLEMKTWMLFWQQQQSCNDSNLGQPPLPPPPSFLAQKHLRKPKCVQGVGEYAQTAMRELLGIYGLERGAAVNPATGLHPNARAASPAAEGQAARTAADSIAALRTSSTPSGGQQPPTPPHTPKTANATAGQSSGRTSDYLPASDPSSQLMALQSHMHSMLNNARQPCKQQRDESPTGVVDFRQMPPTQQQVASSKTAPFVDHHDDAAFKAQQDGDGRKAGGSRHGTGSTGSGGGSKSSAPIDYSRYVKRFGSAAECGSPYCKDLNYREHFHCLDCHPRVFVKKEEMIRHFKWHKKRDESLQHGFMRYSPGDDCNDRYRGCPHNRKQTHYHCVKEGCDKVYISTSDVQMHANYHRKDSAIIQEGFQRFRATEDCATAHCAFNGQRTTHFHCRRPPCNYTFKNKADMEKHKSYHIKDEQLARDGFKKFMKNEACQFDSCRFSRVCNHIHCIREGCTYVLHSSGQLYSHKRKHERRDAELAYHGASTSNNNIAAMTNTDSTGSGSNSLSHVVTPSAHVPIGSDDVQQSPMGLSASDLSRLISDPSLTAFLYGRMPSLFNQLEMAHLQHRQRAEQEQRLLAAAAAEANKPKHSKSAAPPRSPSPIMSEEDAFRLCLARVEAGKPCQPDCQIYPHEHYHCRSDGCVLTFKSTEAAKEHWRNHEQQEQISDNYYISVEVDEQPNPCPSNCPYQTRQRHFHCCWDGCAEIILSTDKPFRRLDHYKMHEYSRRGHQTPQAPAPSHPTVTTHSSGGSKEITFTTTSPSSTSFSLDSMFRRKRGRPPKNRVIEVWNESSPMNSGSGQPDTPQAIFTSFKLPKPTTPPLVPYSSSGGLSFAPPPYSLSGPSHSASSSRSNSSEWKNQRTSSPSPERVADGKHNSRRAVVDNKSAQQQKRNVSPSLPPPPPPPLRSPDSPNKSITVVKAAGTFYPSSAFPSKSEGSRILPPPPPASSSSPTPLTVQSSSLSTHSSSLSPSSSSSSTSPSPFTVLSPTAQAPEKPIAYGPEQSCGRPFCKLKRREHYHCVVCNQAFSEMEKLKPHMLKHCTGALSPTLSQWTSSSGIRVTDPTATAAAAVAASGASPDRRMEDVDIKKEELSRLALFNNSAGLGTSSLLHPDANLVDIASRSSAALHALSFMSPLGGPYGLVSPNQSNGSPSSFLPPGLQPIYAGSGLLLNNAMGAFGRPTSPGKNASSTHKRLSSSPIDHLMLSPEAKKMRFQSSMRLLKDEPVPDGYVRFRFNEDCQYAQCGYREHQTHFHCMRTDCGYSFCDKTRFVQHTARHERLDTLMGGDFQQYRANVGCGRTGCLYTASLGTVQNKASHFHCLKCDFVCTDTNKVVAHRRQHQKTDSILAAGFEKFTPSQNCRVDSCPHSNKQTHYHCLKCCYAVLGLAQMSAHKYRHLDSSTP